MENTIMDNYEIKLDRRVLKQLGSQLYGDTPSVIAELVANSYDADANNVWITIDTVNNNVIVEDDGKGMTAGDINESFLNIGYDKRSENGVTDSGRKIMGRKGIGKLATFSLTNTVRVLSSKDHKKAGCLLDFKRITEDIEVIKIAKRLLGYIVGQKDIVSKRRKEDDQRIEDEKIKKKFWENPQTREILELRLNDAEKQVVQEENLQFTRAVNNGKQTKKIFISHKEVHKLYGQFIVDVLETYGVDVVSTIIFTGDRRLGVPQGKDIYDYLKDCFREDLMVIFLFSKAFYDSNICISEAGAAWATNQNCMNVVIDISFSDIEKPSNNALSSIKFQQIRTPDQTITVTEFFKTIIEEGLHLEYDESKLQKALNDVLETDKYSDQKIDFPATFLPKRKFLPVPRCSKCHNIMLLTEENGRLKYVCSNVSCDECYEAVIN